jgi:hypothetical protein
MAPLLAITSLVARTWMERPFEPVREFLKPFVTSLMHIQPNILGAIPEAVPCWSLMRTIKTRRSSTIIQPYPG